ncbi:olfactory receptor 11A1-like [Betta splendens]|uniref:Olfactory receptor n=1 Tax=Betta splendens TaxID=158456 RepID=A0A6P7LCX0_BETSP|nr:olfactory receptor 11A1-like [Betta splendens]
MEDEHNTTYITLGGHLELHTFRYLYFLVMFTAYVLIICFNVSIVCLICVHKSLHEPMYVFIAALLLNSLVFSTNIYPKLLLDFLSDTQVISYSLCLFQFHVYYASAGSEFLLLAAMSYDRYVSICRPLLYPTIMRKSTVSILLVLAWLLPVCSVAVPVSLSADIQLCRFSLDAVYCNNSIYSLDCVSSTVRSVYGLLGLTLTALLPLLFIVFTYSRILMILYNSGRNIRRKAAHTCFPHLLVLLSFSCLSVFDVTIARLGADLPKAAHLVMSLQVILYNPLLNPIIYGLKMKEISKQLEKLLYRVTVN